MSGTTSAVSCCPSCAANQAVPYVWWERSYLKYFLVVCGVVLHLHLVSIYRFQPPTLLAISAAGLGLLGLALDIYSTMKAFDLKNQYDDLGIEFPVRETNLFVSDFPSNREIVWHWTTLLSASLSLMSWYAPAFGLAAFSLHGWAAVNNLRQRIWTASYLEALRQEK